MLSQENPDDATQREPEAGILYTISTRAGIKDYSHDLTDNILYIYESYRYCPSERHDRKLSSLKLSHLTIRSMLGNIADNSEFSVMVLNEGYFALAENVLKQLSSMKNIANPEKSSTLKLNAVLRLLSEKELNDKLLFFILDTKTERIICTGSEKVLRCLDTCIGRATHASNTIWRTQTKFDPTHFPNTKTNETLTHHPRLGTTGTRSHLPPTETNGSKTHPAGVETTLTETTDAKIPYTDGNTESVFPRRQSYSQKHVSVLQKLSPHLSREFRLEGTHLLDYMYEDDALSETDRQSILAQPTEKRKNEAFIDMLCANYSLNKFKEEILPILHKDEANAHLAERIEEELKRAHLLFPESKCTMCKVKGLVDLRALSEHLLSQNAISQNLRRDLCNPSIPSRIKWKELLKEVEKETFLTALEKKYPHFHKLFAETGDSPLVCCCMETDGSGQLESKRCTDVANMEDLYSEIGSTISNDSTRSQVDEKVPKTPNSVWEPPSRDLRLICGICKQMVRELRSLECGHSFCRVCITTVHRLTNKCPVCRRISNAIIGTMPRGTMTHIVDSQELPGFPGYNTIVITYRVEDGVQSDEHPNPNKRYHGISCTAFLPNTLEGQIVLMLLQTAWQRRLTFTLKQSVSSTPHCVLTWNRISHKTNRTGGPDCNGYPDSGYLRRVKKELYNHGIVEEDLRSTMV